MKELPKKYKHREQEKHWQEYWQQEGIYNWKDDQSREDTFVIDTPPPTVSGVLHMGHVFSYVQADIVARYQRMKGKDVFYPMGFDDNGLPTERLVEKVIKRKAVDMSREEFISECERVVETAEKEFEDLFNSIALSVDWNQKYTTISERSRTISQLSFLDLYEKGEVYRQPEPVLWDPADQTALAQADVVDKEQQGVMNDILFGIDGSDEKITIATTRPELLAACVAVLYHPDDKRYQHLKGKHAITALFGVKVPIIPDDKVEIDKGTGIMMCCTFGDQMDVLWWKKHKLPTRIILDKRGRITPLNHSPLGGESKSAEQILVGGKNSEVNNPPRNCDAISAPPQGGGNSPQELLLGKTAKQAKQIVIDLLQTEGLIVKQEPVTQQVKCAERSGCPLEIIVAPQWFINVMDIKKELKEKADECNWNPDYMKVRIEQWIDGLSWDWCISRQRYFGVPFPIWYSKVDKNGYKVGDVIVAKPEQLPVNPLVDLPEDFTKEEVIPDFDVMDTWATSSVSPQLSSWGINTLSNSLSLEGEGGGEGGENKAPPPQPSTLKGEGVTAECNSTKGEGVNARYYLDKERHKKLFPADLRPQAHEIIRTWAFYTIVKAYLHENTIPWKTLMISGWCLAEDKTKMSKSKGNVVTPVTMIEEKGSDVVRYWASTSRLGSDTAYSEDVLKIGNKLINKLWNATKFVSLILGEAPPPQPSPLKGEGATPVFPSKGEGNCSHITETLDKWILTRLNKTIKKATEEFDKYEYCIARMAIEDFFWNDFCDNYLELAKTRAYGEGDISAEASNSAKHTLYFCIDAILRLFAPFIPHITETLYSHIFEEKFAENKSVNARGMWCNADDYPVDENAELGGVLCVEILEEIRKAKSEAAVSIKYPVEKLILPTDKKELLLPVLGDLKNAGSVESVEWGEAVSVELKEAAE